GREPAPEEVAVVLHTSGSTGRPKRVPLRHRNLVVSVANVMETYQLAPDDVSLCVMPLFHVHGLVASALATLASGGSVVVPTAHQMASNPLPPGERKPGTVGPGTGVRIGILDPDGRELSAGQTGELVIAGPNVIDGYEDNPAANADSFVSGWFRTGDQGMIDD